MNTNRVYNSFQELYNELPPPPEHITNPAPLVRQADDRSLSDVSRLFSYTQHRGDSSISDSELIHHTGHFLKRKAGQLKRAAKRKAKETINSTLTMLLDSLRQKALGREAEDRELAVQMLQHPEWTDEDILEARRRIYAKYDAREQKEWEEYQKDPHNKKPPKSVGFLRLAPDERKGGRF